MMSKFTVAVVQHPPVFLNLEASVEKACRLIAEAAEGGADIVVFPETWLPGYPVWLDYAPEAALWNHPPANALFQILFENAMTLQSAHLKTLLAAAQTANVYVVMGLHEREKGTLYNTTLYLGRDGRTFTHHRKLVPTYTERLLWGRGDGSTLNVLETEFGNVSGLICWEHWMPLARAAMHAKEEVLHVAQWPAVKEMHQIASRHYAFEGQCFVAAAGCVLTKQDVLGGFASLKRLDKLAGDLLESMGGTAETQFLFGGSAVIAPNGDYLAGPLFNENGILYAEADPSMMIVGRLTLDTDGHYSRPDVFHLEVDERPQTRITTKR